MKNEEFDSRIVQVVQNNQGVTFAEVCWALSINPQGPQFREVDRSLQRLRKNGRVVYVKGQGWMSK
ncbi:MAG: hypothetical protein MUC88_00350 [Planctomycetes bacterium]|nr:hypothetical protein [Planctomycetota bacterium]